MAHISDRHLTAYIWERRLPAKHEAALVKHVQACAYCRDRAVTAIAIRDQDETYGWIAQSKLPIDLLNAGDDLARQWIDEDDGDDEHAYDADDLREYTDTITEYQ